MSGKLAIFGGAPVRKRFLPYGHQWIDKEDIEAVTKVLKSGWLTQGPQIEEFEKNITQYCHAKYAVAFSSGTAALHATTYAIGITRGDEVITTPITFAADGNCVLYRNGTVKFADIQKDTYNIDPLEINKQITSKTKAIIPVDFAGHPCDLDEIHNIATDNNLIVIEDACHAIGSDYKGKKVGGLSDLTVFSFHPVKTVTTGEGGMVLTNDETYYKKLRLFRTHGILRDPKEMLKNDGDWYYEMHDLGYNYRITDIQCALGISQFRKIEKFVDRRREIANTYNEAFSKLREIITPFEKKEVKSAYHLYTIQLDLQKLRVGRKQIFDSLRAENIGVNVHYIPLHLQPYYKDKFGYKEGDFPAAENYYKRALTLPLFPNMNDKDVKDVIEGVEKIISYYKK
jgi:perosamine synthetase